ncbi:hypothetical protein QP938_13315 [Porticoccaceae bacterium LTM1]|nr:hypothetical protein QP938_13315 [Porticoccaceae bacterium LTM1]
MSEQPDEGQLTGQLLIETVENQIADNNPPEVKLTLMRLTLSGMDRQEAIECIACALSVEVFDVVNNGAKFNAERYAKNLNLLPDMPWEDNE